MICKRYENIIVEVIQNDRQLKDSSKIYANNKKVDENSSQEYVCVMDKIGIIIKNNKDILTGYMKHFSALLNERTNNKHIIIILFCFLYLII